MRELAQRLFDAFFGTTPKGRMLFFLAVGAFVFMNTGRYLFGVVVSSQLPEAVAVATAFFSLVLIYMAITWQIIRIYLGFGGSFDRLAKWLRIESSH